MNANVGETAPDFGPEVFAMEGEFDINAAFQAAMHGIATDAELEVEEKIRRMEVIVNEGKSEVYQAFVDFRAMAAQMELFCNHDHLFGLAAQDSEILAGFMGGHRETQGHDEHHHDHGPESEQHDSDEEDDEEIDPRTGRKRKKRQSWFGVYR